MHYPKTVSVSIVLLSSILPLLEGQSSQEAEKGQLYEGFGDYHREISTDSEKTQSLFDQGMKLLYGFNHDEAIRSFEAAARHDPDAAMPWWGVAYAHGININDPEMTDERSKAARAAADKALARIDDATPVEAALIRAVSARHAYPAPEDRSGLDQVYADAMEKAHEAFPQDPEVGTLFADALMNLQPWDYWTSDGSPKGRIDEIVEALENMMDQYPQHPGANHFYIHAVEVSQDPDRAVMAADRLSALAPGAGHLVHMASHIYIRVGATLKRWMPMQQQWMQTDAILRKRPLRPCMRFTMPTTCISCAMPR